jgi:succinate dehydrogenase / fumarate reductase iron-sulfur subunit
MVINGRPHGPMKATTTCQLHMRSFKDGDTIVIEPFRAKAFPVIRDLVVDRTPFDRIIQSGGFISASTGSAPEANSIPVPKGVSDEAMNAAACIGCGACVAACPNAAAMLGGRQGVPPSASSAGQPERWERALRMVETRTQGRPLHQRGRVHRGAQLIPMRIARMNRDYIKSTIMGPPARSRAAEVPDRRAGDSSVAGPETVLLRRNPELAWAD